MLKRLAKFFSFRSPFWPAFFSATIAPGAGQFLNGELKKGAILFSASAASFLWFSKVVGDRLSLILPGTPDQWKNTPGPLREALMKLIQETPAMFITFQLLVILLWGYGVWDAYTTAKSRRGQRSDIVISPRDENSI